MTEKVNAGCDQTVSAGTVCQLHLHEGGWVVRGCYSRFAVHKAFITKMKAHWRVQWCKIQAHWWTEMWGKRWYGQMSHPSPYSSQVGENTWSIHQDKGAGLSAWPLEWSFILTWSVLLVDVNASNYRHQKLCELNNIAFTYSQQI